MDLIGRNGQPLSIAGMALPYREWIAVRGQPESFLPGAFSRQFDADTWLEGVPVTWEHTTDHVIVESHSVSLLDSKRGLFFHATIPDTALGRHAAMSASTGALAASVLCHINGSDDSGAVRSARLSSIGLCFEPAYKTACWRTDLNPAHLPAEASAIRSRFLAADMGARSKSTQTVQCNAATQSSPAASIRAERRTAKMHEHERAARNNARWIESGDLDRELREMANLSRRMKRC